MFASLYQCYQSPGQRKYDKAEGNCFYGKPCCSSHASAAESVSLVFACRPRPSLAYISSSSSHCLLIVLSFPKLSAWLFPSDLIYQF